MEARSGGSGETVIAGTHFDTRAIRRFGPELTANPGADDCASGSSVIAETLRILVNAKFVPGRPIEFHWYAAEEFGLLGSYEVARDYAKRMENVLVYLNLDQSGYVKKGTTPTIGIMTDYVSKPATDFLRLVAKAYTTVTVFADARCGCIFKLTIDECTDHAAWTNNGFHAALAFESDFKNAFPYNDRVNNDGSFLDTVDVINFPHGILSFIVVLQFVRNTIGYVVELSLAAKK